MISFFFTSWSASQKMVMMMALKLSDEMLETDIYFNTIDDLETENKQAGFNDEDQSFNAWLNREIWDHDEELLEAKGWDLSVWDLNPQLMWVHNYDQKPLGIGLWAKRKLSEEPPGLLWRPSFTKITEEGIETYKLYKARILRAFSAGFKPKESDRDSDKQGRKIYKKMLLLEGSAVPIPANFLSLTLALENDFIKSKILKTSFDDVLARTDSRLFQTNMEDRELEYIEKSFGTIKTKHKIAETKPKAIKKMATSDQISKIWDQALVIQNTLKEIGAGYVAVSIDRIEISQVDTESELWRLRDYKPDKEKHPDVINASDFDDDIDIDLDELLGSGGDALDAEGDIENILVSVGDGAGTEINIEVLT